MIKVTNENTLSDIGTHNGIFHSDDVVAVALLDILNGQENELKVIRSRNIDMLRNNTLMMVDIGEGSFDHHQKGGNGTRDNGIDYASAGLIWKYFGGAIINKYESNIDNIYINELFNEIDKEIIQKVDAEDNGQINESHTFSFISSFLPIWTDTNKDYDKSFEECSNIVSKILNSIIKTKIAYYEAKNEIDKRLSDDNYMIKNILLIPSQTIPWTDIIIEINETADNPIDFVAFPYPAGGYAIQSVPPSKEDKFGQRIPFPDKWAGETDDLAYISGIESAILCHRGKFFARAMELEDIILMGEKATKNYKHDKTLILTNKNEVNK